jgi:hypothetical protein
MPDKMIISNFAGIGAGPIGKLEASYTNTIAEGLVD